MDKKSFIRGFGIGVLFSATVLGVSSTIRTSDSFVRSRAGELGMVEASKEEESLFTTSSPKASAQVTTTPKASSATKKTQESASASPGASVTPSDSPTKKPDDSAKPTASSAAKSSSNTSDSDMKKEKEQMEKDLKEEEKKLTVSNGDWSSDVSKKLEDLGIIDDSKAFDKYLNDNGYSSSISSGTYDVSIDDTYAELAKKITGK